MNDPSSGSSNQPRDVWITGIGLLSSFGEGGDAHWQRLTSDPSPVIDTERFAPYPVHPLAEPDWSGQISRRDMRQMEPWQQIGTYTAGLALDDAGLKDDLEACGELDMIIAAGGGERDIETDSAILEDGLTSNDRDALLTERLSNDLRPTLFLAQLSNLLAGNISIVHKVTGSSRTFMGEEGAGISAVQTAAARIRSGQSERVLVGGALNAERKDVLLAFELDHQLLQGEHREVWNRQSAGDGMVAGSVGAFLVLESPQSATARGQKPYAKISPVLADHGRRRTDQTNARIEKLIDASGTQDGTPVLSGASGARDITAMERDLLTNKLPNSPVRGFGTSFGHCFETQFPLGVALAALAVSKGQAYPAFGASESGDAGSADKMLVTTIGHWRAEGLASVEKV
ncbi:MAG: beta-ketoacyl-ACP synthase [Pseudomonadota bacterium]